jgi:DNA-binding CsgD family transcriptional regulator
VPASLHRCVVLLPHHRGVRTRTTGGSVQGDPVTPFWVKAVIKRGNGEHGWLRERVGAGTGAVLESDTGAVLESDTGAVLESSVAFEELVQTLSRLLIETPSTESEVWSRPKPETEGRSTTRLSPFLILTPREQCVLAELMEGRTVDAIAKANWIALSTVRSQIKSILQKLGVNSQLAAVALARQAVGCIWEALRVHANAFRAAR